MDRGRLRCRADRLFELRDGEVVRLRSVKLGAEGIEIVDRWSPEPHPRTHWPRRLTALASHDGPANEVPVFSIAIKASAASLANPISRIPAAVCSMSYSTRRISATPFRITA